MRKSDKGIIIVLYCALVGFFIVYNRKETGGYDEAGVASLIDTVLILFAALLLFIIWRLLKKFD